MITETVYNHKTEKHETITWSKTGTEYYYDCQDNHNIHHIVDTEHGMLARFLGDSYSQLFPGQKVPNNSDKALNLAHSLLY